MAARKIQDDAEVKRWIAEGRTFHWMAQEYLRKYNIQISHTAFAQFRVRHGLARRIVRDVSLLPWAILPKHRWNYHAAMLRAEGRRRAGAPLRALDAQRLPGWKANLAADGAVIHYDPDTVQGFFRVYARPAIDTDLVRVPDSVTGRLPVDQYLPQEAP